MQNNNNVKNILHLKMSSHIVGFGKYKDRDLHFLLQDKKYVDWLVLQPWFEKTYPELYKIVVKTLSPNRDCPTPEHNRIQNMFLKTDFCLHFYKKVTGLIVNDIKAIFEAQHNWDVILTPICDDRLCGNNVLKRKTYPTVYIEIKTSVSDEYPCILRKMKTQIRSSQTVLTQSAYVLFIRDFTSVSASREQLRQIFGQEFDIKVVIADEV
jgi:hypothetical protein